MAENLTHQLIAAHRVEGDMEPGEPVAIAIDQTLTQDATGTLAMLEFEALGVPRVATELSAQYVDHNLLQADEKNADDHLFLLSACRKFGLWYSPAGNGVSHPVHMERFGSPGKTLLGADSHTCAAGSLGMLAIGAGGLAVALAMAGEPFRLRMPRVMGVELTGELPPWVSAKDVVLEMLRRHGVRGGRGKIIEYHGPGLAGLSAMDRHVIANMGQELGATTSVFPADERVREFLRSQGRANDYRPLAAEAGCRYDEREHIDLGTLEPLIACPSSPGNVVPVAEVAGRPVYQCYIGSSANPGLRDLAVPALMVSGRRVHPGVSFDINPTSRQMLENLIEMGLLGPLLHAGARLHQTGCNGCIGMGQAPASGRISLRTVPRNFPGRSGTADDQVYLCSPETAAASALEGRITDPRTLSMGCPRFREPGRLKLATEALVPPAASDAGVELEKGPNIEPLPELEALPERLEAAVALKLGDDVSTDEILPAGAAVLPYRSNIPKIAEFAFRAYDGDFHERARRYADPGFVIVGGENYGQGSSREHAALAPRYLGLRVVAAKSFARIHHENLVNFGVLPLTLEEASDYDAVEPDDVLVFDDLRAALEKGARLRARNRRTGKDIGFTHDLGAHQVRRVLAGGLVNDFRAERRSH